MPTTLARVQAELHRLIEGPKAHERIHGLAKITCVARCITATGVDVLAKAKSVLRNVDEVTLQGWPTDAQWPEKVPAWFVAACVPSMTEAEFENYTEQWKGLPPEDRLRATRQEKWSLLEWLYWLEPSRREWHWWDASVDSGGHITATIEINDWPYSLGQVRWLFRAAGAASFEEVA